MTTVYLIRHAEAEGNLYRRAHGHFNSGVTERGYRQIAALAKRFADVPVDAVYASDLVRTQTTALSITRTHGLALHIVPELREIGVGEWEDRTWAWLAQFERERLLLFNTDLARWHVSGGEDIDVVRDRTVNALHGIIAAHIRDEAEYLVRSVREFLSIAKAAGTRAVISITNRTTARKTGAR